MRRSASPPLTAALLGATLALGARASHAAVEFPVTTKHALAVAPGPDGKARVHYPIRGEARSVSVASVTRGDVEAAQVQRHLDAKLVTDEASKEQSVELTLDLAEPLDQASYTVRLSFLDGQSAPSFGVVQLVLLPAHLAAPPKQIVEQIDGELEGAPALPLVETSGLSRLSIREVASVSAFRDGDQEIAPRLTLALPTAPIAPGKVVLAPVGIATPFPIGTWTSTMRISAPELEAPVDVTYEVHARRGQRWIFFAALGGLVAGFLVREVFGKLAGLGEARSKADEMLGRLDGERKSRLDAIFRKAVSGAVATLLEARRTARDAASLNAATLAADRALSEALGDLKTRKDRLAATYEGLKELLRARYHLPPRLRERLGAATAPLAAAAARLNDDDADPEPLEAVEADLADAAAVLGDEWRVRVLNLLGRLPPLDALVSDAGGGATPASVRAALLEAPAKDAAARDLLETLSRQHQQVASLERRLLLAIRAAAESFARLGRSPSPPLDALNAEIARLQEIHEQHPEEPEELFQAAAARTASLLEAAAMGLASVTISAEVQALVRRGAYGEAAQKMAENPLPAPIVVFSPLEGESPESPMIAPGGPPPPSRALGDVSEAAARPIAAAGDTLTESPAVAPFMLDAGGLSLAARAATAVFVGGIVGLAAMAIYEKTFVGTGSDLLTIFGWTWGLNAASLEAATSALGKIGGKSE